MDSIEINGNLLKSIEIHWNPLKSMESIGIHWSLSEGGIVFLIFLILLTFLNILEPICIDFALLLQALFKKTLAFLTVFGGAKL